MHVARCALPEQFQLFKALALALSIYHILYSLALCWYIFILKYIFVYELCAEFVFMKMKMKSVAITL